MNINSEIIKIFNKREELENKYNLLMNEFKTKANYLVELSLDLYQIEHTIRLNQISLKDYILNSEICIFLKENNYSNYSIDELKKYFDKYEDNNNEIDSYRLALSLYEKLDEIKELEDGIIKLELDGLNNIFKNIYSIKNIEKDKYEELYNNLVIELKDLFNNNLIDKEIYNNILIMFNDIFNYYLKGNKEIDL